VNRESEGQRGEAFNKKFNREVQIKSSREKFNEEVQ
jgi:hypothetical protein